MGFGRAANSAWKTRWRQTHRRDARGGQRRDVCFEYRLPMACNPEGSAAEKHYSRLPHPMEVGWNAGSHPSCALRHVPGDGGERSFSHGVHHRQPEREKCRKGGPRLDPHGFDAGKLIKGKKRHVLVDMQGLLLKGLVTAADVQDRDGGIALLAALFGLF